MTRADLIDALASKTGVSKTMADRVVSVVYSSMFRELAGGGRVEIRGLGSFSIREYEGYEGRNPRTGRTVSVAPKKLPFFKCGKELKSMVDQKNTD